MRHANPDKWFGEVIRQRRHGLGLTLQQVADLCGCTKAYLSTVETGRTGRPSGPILAALERVMGYPQGELAHFAHVTTGLESIRWAVQRALTAVRQAPTASDDEIISYLTPGHEHVSRWGGERSGGTATLEVEAMPRLGENVDRQWVD